MAQILEVDPAQLSALAQAVSTAGVKLLLASNHGDMGGDQLSSRLHQTGWGTNLAASLGAYKEVWGSDVSETKQMCTNAGSFMESFAAEVSQIDSAGSSSFQRY